MLQAMQRDKRGREAGQSGASRDLVLVKRDLIRERYDVRYSSASYRYRGSGHYSAGRAAGAGVRIRPGVAGGDGDRLE